MSSISRSHEVDDSLMHRVNSLGEKMLMHVIPSTRIDQHDEDLIRTIRNNYFIPPSTLPYNLKSEENPSMGQGQLMELLFENEVL